VNKEKRFYFIWAVLALLISSCAGKPQVPVPAETARIYETKAQIKAGGETNTVKIQLAVAPQKAIRMEVTATLGVSVASVLITPKEIRIALPQQRTFIIGPFHEKTLYPVFKENINPRLIWKIIHEQNPSEKNFVCKLNAISQPVLCDGTDGLRVEWVYETPIRKRIDLKRNQFEMSWIFKDQTAMPTYQTETFVLKKPDGYKEIIIK
jgi:hypothetical protein